MREIDQRLDALSKAWRLSSKIETANLPRVAGKVALACVPLYRNVVGRIALAAGMLRITKSGGYERSLAVVAIARNESEYIREWVAFHKAVGISVIYLYDNDSTDSMLDEIQDFIDERFVIVTEIHGKSRQYDAYTDALHRYGPTCKYMAFIDCDEFIMPEIYGTNMVDVLDDLFSASKNIGGVAVNWCMYGSSGFENKPDGLLIENFVWRAHTDGGKGNRCIKSIVRPACVKRFTHPHYPQYRFGYYAVNTEGHVVLDAYNTIQEYVGLRINHYFTKSRQQWIKRRALGMADKNAKRTLDEFYQHDNNDIEDLAAYRYVESVKSLLSYETSRRTLASEGRIPAAEREPATYEKT